MVLNGTLTIGELTAFVLYLDGVLRADPAARAALHDLPVGAGGGRQAARPARDAAERPRACRTRSTSRRSTGTIVLDHVTFGYDRGPVGAPRRRRSTIAPGETFALVGATGAGKSTIAKLVTRFYDPHAGARADRRPRPARRHARVAAAAARRRAAGAVPVRRLRALQHRLRAARRHRRGGASRRVAPSASTSSSTRLPARPRHARARTGSDALVGRAAAARARPRVPRPAACARARRGDRQPRPAVRSPRSSMGSTCCSRVAPRS